MENQKNVYQIKSILFLFFLAWVIIACQNQKPSTEEQTNQSAESMTENNAFQNPDVNVDLNLIMGKFEPANHPDFHLVASAYADRSGLYLHKKTYKAFLKMHNAAKQAGIELVIRSAARNFDYQKNIWERKWTGATELTGGINASEVFPNKEQRALEILKYSSMPGTSRHHWGTDIDLNAFDNSFFESGEGLKIFTWLENNAKDFGFCRPYTQKGTDRNEGYEEEKWHWSYQPLSVPFTQYATENLKNELIEGFQGAEVATKIDVVGKYVLGISPACMH